MTRLRRRALPGHCRTCGKLCNDSLELAERFADFQRTRAVRLGVTKPAQRAYRCRDTGRGTYRPLRPPAVTP